MNTINPVWRYRYRRTRVSPCTEWKHAINISLLAKIIWVIFFALITACSTGSGGNDEKVPNDTNGDQTQNSDPAGEDTTPDNAPDNMDIVIPEGSVGLTVLDTRRVALEDAAIYLNDEQSPAAFTDMDGFVLVDMQAVQAIHVIAAGHTPKSYFAPNWGERETLRLRRKPIPAGSIRGSLSGVVNGDNMFIYSTNGYQRKAISKIYFDTFGDNSFTIDEGFPGGIVDIAVIPGDINTRDDNLLFGLLENVDTRDDVSDVEVNIQHHGGKTFVVTYDTSLGNSQPSVRYRIWKYADRWGLLGTGESYGFNRGTADTARVTIPYATGFSSLVLRATLQGDNSPMYERSLYFNSDTELLNATEEVQLSKPGRRLASMEPTHNSFDISLATDFAWAVEDSDFSYIKINVYDDVGLYDVQVWEAVIVGDLTEVAIPPVAALTADTTYHYTIYAIKETRDGNDILTTEDITGVRRIHFTTIGDAG